MGADDVDLSYEDLVTLVEELKRENTRLRDVLGLDARAESGHEAAWAPTLFTRPSEAPTIDATATAAERLALLWSRFGARSDVYAMRWGERIERKGGLVACHQGWLVEEARGQGLPSPDRRGLPQASSR